MIGEAERTTIPKLLVDAAARHGNHPAVVDGDLTVGYRELADLVFRTARAYIAVGVRPGDRVAVWAPNGLQFILAMLGAQCAGACLVPLNTRYRGHEAAELLLRSRATALVVANGFLGTDYTAMLRQAAAEMPGDGTSAVPGLPDLHTLVDLSAQRSTPALLAWRDFLAGAESVPLDESTRLAAAVRPDDLCDIMFTSGTTGLPKGVMSAHRQTTGVAEVWAHGAGLRPTDRYAIVSPFFHGFGYKAGVIAALTAGSTIHPVQVFDGDAVLELIQAARISVLPGAPTVFTTLLNHPRLREYDISSLRFAIAGAAVVPASLFRQMRDVLGFDTVAQAYGLTECVVATQSRPGEDPEHVAQTVGPAVPGIEIRVVDADGKQLAAGQDGEVLLRGAHVMLGYFEDEEATRRAVDMHGWLHTGDVGQLDEHGCLQITDRLKDMFTVGGFNVYPAEVEKVLVSHPELAEAAVVGAPDARLGSVAWAYVVPRHGARPDPDEVLAYCRERLANYKAPRKVIVTAEFPRNAGGKVLKSRLPTHSRDLSR
ncbi:AMP-binding protein [Streptomyces sp. NY05-11A]|uniref:AMP-binding protein n=1 Tax=Streptomyces soliscabiei TaxID=588897 RepID=UPI0029B01B6C|nr:AMP-binding protein [Streptomyces sp. NY05-11A]MDX2676730.1 AMP-binding protein [Streptomyces sp. NY05-11A]